MYLNQALADELKKSNPDHSEAHAFLTTYILLEIVDRFLRHNNFEEAANALASEHMP